MIFIEPEPLILIEALVVLRDAGKLSHALLDAMLCKLPLVRDEYNYARLGSGGDHYDADWPEYLGSSAEHSWEDHWAESRCGHPEAEEEELLDPKTWPQPVTSDSATAGHLLVLLGEATGAVVLRTETGMGRSSVYWETGGGISSACSFEAVGTVGDAAALALIDLAEKTRAEAR
jgi:hypothetical protein